MKMFMLPIPQGFDTSVHKEGDTFEITATVHMTKDGLEVEAVEGVPIEKNESPQEEADESDTEMDEEGFDKAMGRGKSMMEETE